MKTLHVETGRHLYGGAQQVLWLLDGLRDEGGTPVLVGQRDSALSVAAEEAGHRVIELDSRGDLDLGFYWNLRRVLRNERPQLLHAHSRRGADWFGGRAAHACDVPAVVSRRVDNREAAWVARMRYRHYRRIVAISDAIAEVLQADGVDAERIRVIRSAVDTKRFAECAGRAELLERFGLPDDAVVAFCIAQLIPRKGHRFLLEALADLRARYPHLRVVLFGQGALESALRRSVNEAGLADAVRFAGFDPDLDDWLNCADLLVHPALKEGLGVAALKAAAAGLPVVAFAAGGLREAVVDGETGLLVDTGNTEALAAAIARLLDDPKYARQLGENGRRRMRREFRITDMVAAHLRLYHEVLA